MIKKNRSNFYLLSLIDFFIKKINFIKILFYFFRKIPFSKGYDSYKWHRISNIIKNTNKKKTNSVNVYNAEGLDERLVEYKWIMQELKKKSGLLLDAGSVLNFSIILNELIKRYKIIIQTLYPENYYFNNYSVSYFYLDLKEKFFKENIFDIVVCISTLEHVGFNNNKYNYFGQKKEYLPAKNNSNYKEVIKNIYRILKPGGTVYISLPFGKKQIFEDLQQFDSKMINDVINIFKPKKFNKRFVLYKNHSWIEVLEEDCLESEFRHNYKVKSIDNAASARAVVLIEMVK
jgi:SAM-dependent methyltransferase